MKTYQNFIGIDIGKFSFFISIQGQKEVVEFKNDAEGINNFLKINRKILKSAFCVLETTGGYEFQLLYALCDIDTAVHRGVMLESCVRLKN